MLEVNALHTICSPLMLKNGFVRTSHPKAVAIEECQSVTSLAFPFLGLITLSGDLCLLVKTKTQQTS